MGYVQTIPTAVLWFMLEWKLRTAHHFPSAGCPQTDPGGIQTHGQGAREGFPSSFRAAAMLFSLLPPAPAHLHLPSGEGKDKPPANRALLQISSCCLTRVRLHPCYLSLEHSVKCNGIAGAVPNHCGMLASVNKTLSKGNI